MNRQEVIDLMRSSKDSNEWKQNADKVKKAHNDGYPAYWFMDIITSGLCDEVLGKGSSELKITTGKDALKFLDGAE